MEERSAMILLFLCLNLYFSDASNNTIRIPVRLQSDPAKYWKLLTAFSGYDVIHGDPMPSVTTEVDPGIKNQIFIPVKRLSPSEYEWDGCTVLDEVACHAGIETEVITTASEYKKVTTDTSKKGSGTGFKRKISVTTSDPDGMISISEDFEISASSSWQKSDSSASIEQHLTKGGRAASLAYSECVINNVQLDGYLLPRFTPGFKAAIHQLASLSDKTKVSNETRQREFQKFMTQYGTHYQTQITMGARMVETKLYTSDLRKSYSRDTAKHCSASSSKVNILWIHHESSEYHCSASDNEQFKAGSNILAKTTFATYGSTPRKTISDWASQEFSPVPLTREMMPIVNLFDNQILVDQGIQINTQALLDWILPMYINYGKFMEIDLRQTRGCGASVDCSFNKYCLSLDTKGDHICLPVEAQENQKQGWYLKHTRPEEVTKETWSEEKRPILKDIHRSDGTLSTWFTTSHFKFCCAEKHRSTKCLWNPFTKVCAITYNVTFLQNNDINKNSSTENQKPRIRDNGIHQGYPITAFYPRIAANRVFMFEKDRLTIKIRMGSASEEKCRRICEDLQSHEPKYSSCSRGYLSECIVVYNHVAHQKSSKDFHYIMYGN